MNTITQTMRFWQALVAYSYKHGVTQAAATKLTALQKHKIAHKRIRPFTPRHNGKVERSRRKDNEYFYASHMFYSFDDFAKQLLVHNPNYNNFPMRPLHWNAPTDYIQPFLENGELFS